MAGLELGEEVTGVKDRKKRKLERSEESLAIHRR